MRGPGPAVLCAAAFLLAIPARAQVPQTVPPEQAVERGREVRIRLMTMGQGDAIWERFGHNAIWISESPAGGGLEVAYNWGIFDFNEPGFLVRFLTADTRYWMDGFDALQTARLYQQRNRSVIAGQLAMNARQRGDLATFVRWNSLPEYKYYQYDYFLDNCSTRVRDVLDRAMKGAIRAHTDSIRSGTTFRRHTQRMLQGQPLAYTGITIALGQPADREISAWEEMFLPGKLHEHLRGVQVDTGDGRLQPFVSSEAELFVATRSAEPAVASSYVTYYVAAGLAIAALLVIAALFAKPLFAILAAGWLALSGVLGLILVLAWGFTRHIFWYRNENVLLLHPLLLVLAVMAPLALRHKASPALQRRTTWFATGVASVATLGVLLKVFPFFYQQNWEVIALILPSHLAITAMLWRRYRAFPMSS